MDDLVVMALPMEACDSFTDIPVLFTGVGKVNAAYALTKALAAGTPKRVINFGSAGSHVFPTSSLVCITEFLQRDMEVSPLGFSPFQTPFEDNIALKNGNHVIGLNTAICGTGDNFVNAKAEAPYNVVDMEAFALAKICHLEDIPFYCIKYISDNSDDAAHLDWEASLKRGAVMMRSQYNIL